MKELYEKYIKITQDEKMTDGVFSMRITMSVIAILTCMTVMFSTAFAFFSSNLTKNFTMRAAVWDVFVTEESSGGVSNPYECPLVADEVHKFTISRTGAATATEGYCEIRITGVDGVTESFYTASFDNEFKINIQAVEGTEIEFLPWWGKPANYDIISVFMDGDTFTHSYTEAEEADTASEDGDESVDETEDESEKTDTSEKNTDGSDSGENMSGDLGDSSSESSSSSEGSSTSESGSSSDDGSSSSNGDGGSSDGGSISSGGDGSSSDGGSSSGSGSSDSLSGSGGASASSGGESASSGASSSSADGGSSSGGGESSSPSSSSEGSAE